MSLVTASQLNLTRSRKALEKAYSAKDWHAVRHWDLELAGFMNDVFDDKQRDVKILLNELENILMMYSKIIAELPSEVSGYATAPKK